MDWPQLFSAIGAVSQLLAALAVSAGVFIARRQLGVWRKEKLHLKQADLAEDIIALAYDIRRSFMVIRSPMGRMAPSESENDGTYDFKWRLEKLDELRSDMLRLEKLRVRQEIVIKSSPADKAIDDIFNVHVDLTVALQGIFRDIWRYNSRPNASVSEASLERRERYEDLLWGGEGEDEVGKKIENAVVVLKREMIPFVRLEAKK